MQEPAPGVYVAESIASDPWGLGWAARLLRPAVTDGLSPTDAHKLKLWFGLCLFGTPACVMWAVPVFMEGNIVLGGLITGAAVAMLLSILVIALAPGGYKWIVHLTLVALTVVNTFQIWQMGGMEDGAAQAVWWMYSPVIATLIIGVRHGFAWMLAVLGIVGTSPFLTILFGPPAVIMDLPPAAATMSFGAMTIMLALTVFWFVQQRQIVERQLQIEHGRAEALLHNVLPAVVAKRLQKTGTEARLYEEAGVLFADLAGFTQLSSRLPATRLVQMLDRLFGQIDELAERHGVCKIKTIGDCYMVASGIPEPAADHLERLAAFSLDLRDMCAVGELADLDVRLRIGIATGPAVAGVVGRTRLLYDLWGDTVNTASRMESHGLIGKVHVTDAVRTCLTRSHTFEDRGEIEVKGKGTMRTWVLTGTR